MIATCFVLMALSGVVWNSFALFLVALEDDTGWSRGSISLAFGTFALMNAIMAPAVGWAMTRWDSRMVLALLACVLSVGLAGAGLAASPPQYSLFFGVLGGLGANCFSSFAIFTILGTHIRRRAASAMAVADSGSGLGAFLGMPLIQFLIASHGWRTVSVGLAAAVAMLAIGLHLLALPAVRRTRPAAGVGDRGNLRDAGMLWKLSLMALSFLCGSAAFQAVQTQQVALMQDGGVAAGDAVWIAAMGALLVFCWRLGSGWLCDRYGERATMGISAAGAVAALSALYLFSFTQSPASLLVYAATFGIGFGGQAMLLAIGTRNLVPQHSFSLAFGTLRLSGGLGMFIGPVVAAFAFEATGDYLVALASVSGFAVLHFAAFRWATSRNAASTGLLLR